MRCKPVVADSEEHATHSGAVLHAGTFAVVFHSRNRVVNRVHRDSALVTFNSPRPQRSQCVGDRGGLIGGFGTTTHAVRHIRFAAIFNRKSTYAEIPAKIRDFQGLTPVIVRLIIVGVEVIQAGNADDLSGTAAHTTYSRLVGDPVANGDPSEGLEPWG